jgi:hypothetical protein
MQPLAVLLQRSAIKDTAFPVLLRHATELSLDFDALLCLTCFRRRTTTTDMADMGSMCFFGWTTMGLSSV